MKKSFKNGMNTCAMAADASFCAENNGLVTDTLMVSVSIIPTLVLRLTGLIIGVIRKSPEIAL